MVRIKHRYLLLSILYPQEKPTTSSKPNQNVPWTVQFRQPSSDRLDAKLLARVIRDGVLELFGDYGAGMVAGSLQVKYMSAATSTAIVRVTRAHYRMVWAALSFATKIPKPVDQTCVIQVVRVSGTIKKSEEEAIRRARATIVRAQRAKAVTLATASGKAPEDNGDDGDDGDMYMANGIEDFDGPEAGDTDEED